MRIHNRDSACQGRLFQDRGYSLVLDRQPLVPVDYSSDGSGATSALLDDAEERRLLCGRRGNKGWWAGSDGDGEDPELVEALSDVNPLWTTGPS